MLGGPSTHFMPAGFIIIISLSAVSWAWAGRAPRHNSTIALNSGQCASCLFIFVSFLPRHRLAGDEGWAAPEGRVVPRNHRRGGTRAADKHAIALDGGPCGAE